MEIPFAQMRSDFASLVGDWGVSCDVTRNTGTTDTGGRRTNNWTALVTETFWLQSAAVTDKERAEQGVVEGSTHVAFQAHDGTPLLETDKLVAAGDPVAYDVVGVQVFPNHRRNWLKQVKK